MAPTSQEPTATLIGRARELLDGGLHREAALVVEPLLLRDPLNAAARGVRERARAAAAEEEREREARLEAAQGALATGDAVGARELLEQAAAAGSEPALELLERLDPRRGRVAIPASTEPTPAEAHHSRRPHWSVSRHAFAAAWAAAVALLAAGAVLGWGRLVDRLLQPPVTRARLVALAPLAGESGLAEARRCLEQGDAAGALVALDAIVPADPAYPFARRMRARAAQLVAGEPSR